MPAGRRVPALASIRPGPDPRSWNEYTGCGVCAAWAQPSRPPQRGDPRRDPTRNRSGFCGPKRAFVGRCGIDEIERKPLPGADFPSFPRPSANAPPPLPKLDVAGSTPVARSRLNMPRRRGLLLRRRARFCIVFGGVPVGLRLARLHHRQSGAGSPRRGRSPAPETLDCPSFGWANRPARFGFEIGG
jgi:hypothetical protein